MTAVKEGQVLNASIPMVVTVAGIVISVKLKQQLKAYFPILVNPAGRMTEVRLLHPLNAPKPSVFVSGWIAMDVQVSSATSIRTE